MFVLVSQQMDSIMFVFLTVQFLTNNTCMPYQSINKCVFVRIGTGIQVVVHNSKVTWESMEKKSIDPQGFFTNRDTQGTTTLAD